MEGSDAPSRAAEAADVDLIVTLQLLRVREYLRCKRAKARTNNSGLLQAYTAAKLIRLFQAG